MQLLEVVEREGLPVMPRPLLLMAAAVVVVLRPLHQKLVGEEPRPLLLLLRPLPHLPHAHLCEHFFLFFCSDSNYPEKVNSN